MLRQFQAVHRTWHLDIGEESMNALYPRFTYRQGSVGMLRFEHDQSFGGKHVRDKHAQQKLIFSHENNQGPFDANDVAICGKARWSPRVPRHRDGFYEKDHDVSNPRCEKLLPVMSKLRGRFHSGAPTSPTFRCAVASSTWPR
jgi:hypothetical protein